MFVHLHTHSYYSFLEGVVSPAGLAQAAAQAGMPALALTDRHSLTGAIEFYDACRSVGIQPILGLTLNVAAPPSFFALSAGAGDGDLVLLAQDLSGWANLCRLSSGLLPGQQALDFETLEQYSDSLICLTGGLRGLATALVRGGREGPALQLLDELAHVFPDRLYVQLQRHAPSDRRWMAGLARLARQLHLPLVATHAVHYLEAEDAGRQRLLSAIRLNCTLQDLPEDAAAPADATLLSGPAMAARFSLYPAALSAAQEIAGRCHLELPLGKPLFPAITLPHGQSADDVLRSKAEAGARRLYGDLTPDLAQRLEHELTTIAGLGYAPLFLIMEDILAFARRGSIPTASRGSASSSLVAHCLGITDPDPVELDLYFERFLNPARSTPPDIDVDLCSRRRDEVIHYVYRRFGQDRSAMVCTISRFRRRSALRETAKAYGLPPRQISRLAGELPHRWYGPRPASDEAPYIDLVERYKDPQIQQVLQAAAALIGLPHHLSVHPGGMVIAPGPINELAPTQMAPKGVIITQLDLESIERLGLVKIDLLGIRGLTVLGDVARALDPQSSGAATTGPSLLGPDPFPDDDEATRATLSDGRTIGCFQIESPGMRATLRAIRAESMDDLMIALALYRPGPLTGGLWDAFVRRHRGEEAPHYLHPALEPLLADTYGVILYQEQVLRIAHELAGLSLADADLLRRAMSHFDPGERMRTLQEKFIAGAQAKSGVGPAVAGRVWELMAAFAGYGFPKAHAASYASVGWRAAWCKTHYPELFMAAVLANWGGYYSQRVYLTEARRLGLAVRGPHVNYAGREFSVRYLDEGPVLFMGLDQVKGLSRALQARILRRRPFNSLDDFLARVDPRPVEAEKLALAGALEGFGSLPALLRRLKQGDWRGGQLPLFPLNAPPEEEWSLAQRAEAQEAVLGLSVVAHPLELAGVQDADALSILQAVERRGEIVTVAGMRQAWRRSAANGETVYIMTLEDLEGMMEVVIPAAVYRQSKAALSDSGPYWVEGRVEPDPQGGEPFLRATRIERIS